MRLRQRVALGFLLAAGLGAALGGLVLHRRLLALAEQSARARIRGEAAVVAAWVEAAGPSADPQRLAQEAGRRLRARVTLIAPGGAVLGDSSVERSALAGLENHSGRPEIRRALEVGSGEDERRSATTGTGFFYAASIVPGDGAARVARVALPVSEIRGQASRALGWITPAVLLVLAAVGPAAYLAGRSLSRRLEELVESALPGGAPAPEPPSGDEIARLGAALRTIRKRTAERLAELDTERQRFQAVLRGMNEGVVLVGEDGRIRLANEAFRSIFGVEGNPAGRSLAEIVRHPEALGALERVLRERREAPAAVIEEPVSGRAFEVRVAPLWPGADTGDSAAVVLFLDVSRLLALERVRREFVADVSHELRNPLTSVLGAIETLLDEDLGDREAALRLLEVARRHGRRIETLLDDLTDLSLIETGAVRLELTPLDAAEVAEEVASQLRPKAEAAGVELRQEIPSPLPIRADRRRLEQILVNLVDNAIKFNRRGGVVRLAAEPAGPGARIVVEDTGVGIPADALDKVFHRFYRGDRARGGDVPGTGLGLAIVKHLMGLHGGRVSVRSELGRGSRFVLEFPAAG